MHPPDLPPSLLTCMGTAPPPGLQAALTVEAERRESVRARVKSALQRRHGAALRNRNLPRFLADLGVPVEGES